MSKPMASLRSTSFSEFALRQPSSRVASIRAKQLASDLLRYNSRTSKMLPSRRLPTYPEFLKLLRAAYPHEREDNDGLPRSVNTYRSMVELRRAQLDRMHNKTIKSVLDTRSYCEDKASMLSTNRLTADIAQKQAILRQNLTILRRINRIQRLHGKVECFNRNAEKVPSNRSKLKQEALELGKQNKFLGCRLLDAKSKIDCHNPWVPPTTVIKQKAPMETVLQYQPYMPTPELGTRNAHSLLRPLVYFDLAVPDEQPLGRLVFKLYTEVSPEVVLEFVRLATYNEVQAHRVLRIFSDLWMEGELIPSERDALIRHHSKKTSPLDPTQMTGVLSYAWDYRQQFPQGMLSYTISFKPLTVVPLQRVVFGRLVAGSRVLQCCREFGTRNGKPKKPVTVIRCGLL